MVSATHKMVLVDIVFQLDCQSVYSIFLKLFVHGLPTMNKQHYPFSQPAKLWKVLSVKLHTSER